MHVSVREYSASVVYMWQISCARGHLLRERRVARKEWRRKAAQQAERAMLQGTGGGKEGE
jgi:hypothetical protein